MFIDASALTAILLNEQDARELLARAENYDTLITSPLAVWETVLAVARDLRRDVKASEETVEAFLALARIIVTPIPSEAGSLAIEAFAYACAKLAGVPPSLQR